MNDDQRKAMFAKMSASQPKASSTVPFHNTGLKLYPSGSLASYLKHGTNQNSIIKAREELWYRQVNQKRDFDVIYDNDGYEHKVEMIERVGANRRFKYGVRVEHYGNNFMGVGKSKSEAFRNAVNTVFHIKSHPHGTVNADHVTRY